MLLARLAVDLRWQIQGVGAALLKDATLRTLQAADIAGIRALVVHAKDERAREFYDRFDFRPSPSDPPHLFLLLKDIQKIEALSKPSHTSQRQAPTNGGHVSAIRARARLASAPHMLTKLLLCEGNELTRHSYERGQRADGPSTIR